MRKKAYIERNKTKLLLTVLKEFPVVGILGPRQCGKTTLANHILERIKQKSVYLDLENFNDLNKLAEPSLYLESNSDKCIVIDEIQKMPSLIELLRSLVDKDRRPGRFIVLGSANPFILKSTSETLAGRIFNIELSPFNYLEIENKIKFNKHWLLGGYPGSILSKSNAASQRWLHSFIDTYIQRDIKSFNINSSSELLLKMLVFIATSQGLIWNASNFSRSLGISVPTVENYLNYFYNSYSIHKLYPFYVNVRKRLIKSPKIYIRDSGLLHYLNNIYTFKELQNNLIIGASFEGYAVEQIYQMINPNIRLYYYRTIDGTEIDLVFVKGNTPVATAEIKYSSSPNVTKSMTIGIQDLGTRNNYIITPYSEEYPIKKNITICNLKDFLKKHLPEIK